MSSEPSKQEETVQPTRRDFLKKSWALAISTVLGLVPLVAGLIVAFDPLRRRGRGGAKFLPVVALTALPADGRAVMFKVHDDQTDAWNRSPRVPIGNVYLRRTGAHAVEAWSATCPHLGCLIEKSGGAFLCPCHNSKFMGDGRIDRAHGVVASPRDMDGLETKIENVDGVEMVTVKFLKFKTGTADKTPA